MAGPIAHVVYAAKALKTFLRDKDEKQFILGNLFPDIRYLGVISRESTHFPNVTLEDVIEESSSFKSGILFHCLIDEVREAFVVKCDAYSKLPNSRLSSVALKVCEDMKLYSLNQHWPRHIGYLNNIDPEETKFGVSNADLQHWYEMHIKFLGNPEPLKSHDFFTSLHFDREEITELFKLVEQINQDQTTDKYIYDFYDNLEHHLLRKDEKETLNSGGF